MLKEILCCISVLLISKPLLKLKWAICLNVTRQLMVQQQQLKIASSTLGSSSQNRQKQPRPQFWRSLSQRWYTDSRMNALEGKIISIRFHVLNWAHTDIDRSRIYLIEVWQDAPYSMEGWGARHNWSPGLVGSRGRSRGGEGKTPPTATIPSWPRCRGTPTAAAALLPELFLLCPNCGLWTAVLDARLSWRQWLWRWVDSPFPYLLPAPCLHPFLPPALAHWLGSKH